MDRAQAYWAQVLDSLNGKSDGPEGAIVEGLRTLRRAEVEGWPVRAWARGRVCTVSVEREGVTLVGRGDSLLDAIENLGMHDAF